MSTTTFVVVPSVVKVRTVTGLGQLLVHGTIHDDGESAHLFVPRTTMVGCFTKLTVANSFITSDARTLANKGGRVVLGL